MERNPVLYPVPPMVPPYKTIVQYYTPETDTQISPVVYVISVCAFRSVQFCPM